jgi:hypothetical protein
MRWAFIKKIFFLLILLTLITPALIQKADASTLSCSSVDGMAIFGYKYGEWKFIGAIANPFNSDSIANEFGAGNEFSSDSIFNEFGTFGSEFSSYSAFNDFASNPPAIINNSYKFVGYLTTNDFKTPNINTYEAIACANNSFKSFTNSNLEGTTFKNLPGSSGYSGYSGYSNEDTENLLENTCPNHSSYQGGECVCDNGHLAVNNECVTYNQACQLEYGSHSYGDEDFCYCSEGYQFNSDKTRCIESPECPNNSTRIESSCVCDEGYVFINSKCITHTEDCRLEFGNHVVGREGDATTNSYCDCESGYMWDVSRAACILQETQPVFPPQPVLTPEPLPEEIGSGVAPLVPQRIEEGDTDSGDIATSSGPTAEMATDTKALDGDDNAPGFLSRVWSSIKSFFSRLFEQA